MEAGLYTYRDEFTPKNLIIYVEVLPFVLYKSGANSLIWNSKNNKKELFYVKEGDWVSKSMEKVK